MAISGVSGASYRDQWEAAGGAYAGLSETDETEESEASGQIWNAVFEEKKSSAIDTDSFLALIVAQMTNQDFMNPMDDTAMVTQMVQMNTMQMMQEMANQTKTSYAMSMVGKTVTAARINVSGNLVTETGVVQKIVLTNNEFAVYVNGKRFTLEQIQEVGTSEALNKADSTNTDSTLTEQETMQRKEYLNSLLGREVTITVTDDEGSYDITGIVEKVSTKDGFRVYVNDEWYSMDDITEVGDKVQSSSGSSGSSGSTGSTDPGASGSTGSTGSTDPAGSVNDPDAAEDVSPDEKVDQDAPVEGEDTDPDITDEDDDEAVDETQTVE